MIVANNVTYKEIVSYYIHTQIIYISRIVMIIGASNLISENSHTR